MRRSGRAREQGTPGGNKKGTAAKGGDGDGSGGCTGPACLGDANGHSRKTSWADILNTLWGIWDNETPEGDQPGMSGGGCTSCSFTPEQQKTATAAKATAQVLVAAAAGIAAKLRRAFSTEKSFLVDMAKADKRTGISRGDMKAYKELNEELPDPFLPDNVRGPEVHPLRTPESRPGPGQSPHGHVGPVHHIPVKEDP
jgi:hypothetical protein